MHSAHERVRRIVVPLYMYMLQNIRQLMSCQSNNVQESTHATFLLCFHSCLLVLPCLLCCPDSCFKKISVDLRNPLIVNKLFCCKNRRPISSTTKCNLTTHYRQNLWQPTNKLKLYVAKAQVWCLNLLGKELAWLH